MDADSRKVFASIVSKVIFILINLLFLIKYIYWALL